MSKRVKLAPNVPQQIALQNPEGKYVPGAYRDSVYFLLTDGRVLQLTTDQTARLNLLELGPEEPFWICRKQDGVTMWLTNSGEKARAEAEQTDSGKELRQSVREIPRREPQRATEATRPRAELLSTGTDGPAPQPQALPKSLPLPPRRIPYFDALREIMGHVLSVLDERGEQWTADAKQDLVSTLFIQAARENRIMFDFGKRGE